MCGIPMLPPPDTARGRKLTFDQVLRHIGGYDQILTAEGREEIEHNVKHYLWKYPGAECWCTACGANVGDLKARHGAEVSCPQCRQAAEFRHVRRGHSRVFDEFNHNFWRRSVVDPETVVLVVTQVWRDSRRERPEAAPLRVKPTAIYACKAGEPVTVYKNHHWYGGDHPAHWSLQKDVHPENAPGGKCIAEVEDKGRIREALRGTALGRVYEAVTRWPYRYDDVVTLAHCAMRPYLEYLVKCGQGGLARELRDARCVGRDIAPKPRADNPRELLGLTEGQWYEVRRDHIALETRTLEMLRAMGRMGWRAPKVAEAAAMVAHYYEVLRVTPAQPTEDSVDAMTRGLPDKLRRAVLRAAIRDGYELRGVRVDYYRALRLLGEDMADRALLLPRDLRAMHDRFTARAAALIEAQKGQRLRDLEAAHRQTLEALRARYAFAAGGLMLRPYETAAEIIEEGKALKICIGTYVERYLTGNTVLCCLRRAEEPDVPWRAVEFSAANGAKVQDRGYKNALSNGRNTPPGDRRQIAQFWRLYDRHIMRRRASSGHV